MQESGWALPEVQKVLIHVIFSGVYGPSYFLGRLTPNRIEIERVHAPLRNNNDQLHSILVLVKLY